MAILLRVGTICARPCLNRLPKEVSIKFDRRQFSTDFIQFILIEDISKGYAAGPDTASSIISSLPDRSWPVARLTGQDRP
jgi:hypothetical protein